MKTIKLAVADDHEIFRKGLRVMTELHDDFEMLYEAGNGKELLTLLENNLKPDILLLDIQMPEMDGIKTQKILSEKYPELKTLILSMHYDEALMGHLFKLGISGYIAKTAGAEKIIDALHAIHKHGFYFDPIQTKEIQQWLSKNVRNTPSLPHEVNLTQREREVLDLICRQCNTGDIAEKLFISASTVKGHRKSLLMKTNTKNTAGLVLFAIKAGYVQVENY